MNINNYEYHITVEGIKGKGVCRTMSDLVELINAFSDKGIHIKRVKVN